MKQRLALVLFVLFLGLTALPSTVSAQYPVPGYYYPPNNNYRGPYPYYPAPAYYQPQPMPRYMPSYPSAYPQAPAYVPGATWQGRPQDKHIVLTPIPTTPTAAPRGVVEPVIAEPAVRPSVRPQPANVEPSLPEPANNDTSGPKSLPAGTPFPLAGATLPPSADAPNTTSPAPVTEVRERPGHRCRVLVFGDFLYWNVHGVDVPFAQPFDGILPALSVPRGPVAVVSPQFHHGFRVGGGFGLGENGQVVATFTYFNTERRENTTAGPGFVLHNFLTFPNTANAAVDSLTSQADYTIRLLMADIDYKCAIVNNDAFTLTWIAGGRYAHLEQNVFNTFQVTGTTTVDSRINFDGIGPRVGLDGKYNIGHGVYGYAQGVVDVLFGQFRGSYREDNVFTGLVGLTSINTNRVVPVLELEVGAGWQSRSGRCRLSGGYYIGSWYNTMTTTSFAGAIGNTNFTTNGNNFRDNLVFDGFVTRFEFRY